MQAQHRTSRSAIARPGSTPSRTPRLKTGEHALSPNTAPDRPAVVIVGAGPSGLALAIELGHRNVSCLVVERNARAGHAPRAKTTHVRTREHLRRWGIASKLAEASPFGIDYPSDIIFVTRLAGQKLAHFRSGLNCSPARHEHYSEHGQWIPQYKLEAVLRDHAASLQSVRILAGTELVDFEQDQDGVSALFREVSSGAERRISTRYLVGADGARSRVRDLIGAEMQGRYGLSRNYNIIFEAPGLAEAHPHGPGIMYWQINPETPSLIGPMDQGDLWFFMPTGLPPGERLSDDDALALIRKATGIDLPYRMLSSDEWVASRLLADRYARGRVFLIGDACHLHPPFGGFGMNMGIADGVDLGWKLAAMLQGWGGQTLLDSYEIERRPVHELVMDEAESNHTLTPDRLFRPGIEEESPEGDAIRAEVSQLIEQHKRAEFYALGVVLGYCYRGSPVVIDDGSGEQWTRSRDYHPSALPGCLAPHRWLSETESLYDRFGDGFTLLAFDAKRDVESIENARADAVRTATPLKIEAISDIDLQRLYGARLALVRPDQHICWRGNSWPADAGILERVTGRAKAPATVLREVDQAASG
ncbi:FAD-dependent monooxygenase [Sphingomonas sp. CGMCC 1.13654]|uniref:FAD-dependent monooxygenase n=2 Tax=Sphingomonas chungangi TaxID=2683589 RepID=A0A838L3M0_9SPHN|nr:FAD-dependent monooxygenase [Sphingomonas chungangi]MVW54853.1 NAD(P)-binding protein [Sphingomonas chungangi]